MSILSIRNVKSLSRTLLRTLGTRSACSMYKLRDNDRISLCAGDANRYRKAEAFELNHFGKLGGGLGRKVCQ